ncbi:MAG TPA: DUF1232 domain-containing protein, partial [Polyangiaceae bacterium]
GYMDDAFVLRKSAVEVTKQGTEAAEHHPIIAKLSAESADVDAFLEEDAERLGEYVSGLRISTVRGRSPSAIVEDTHLAAEVAEEAASWAESYACPSFLRDEKTLVKLKSFLSTKLP